MKNRYVVVVLLLVASVLSGLSQASITNGDFTDGLNHWNPSGEVSVVFYSEPEPGSNYVEFRDYPANSTSSISQSFAVLEGEENLSFEYQMFSAAPPATDKFYAYLNGVQFFYVDNDDFPPNAETVTLDVSSFVGHTVLLKFEFLGDADIDLPTTVYVGKLNLSASSIPIVPVPSAMLLGGLGVAFVNWLRRRRAL